MSFGSGAQRQQSSGSVKHPFNPFVKNGEIRKEGSDISDTADGREK
jgi:hypothetical protein